MGHQALTLTGCHRSLQRRCMANLIRCMSWRAQATRRGCNAVRAWTVVDGGGRWCVTGRNTWPEKERGVVGSERDGGGEQERGGERVNKGEVGDVNAGRGNPGRIQRVILPAQPLHH